MMQKQQQPVARILVVGAQEVGKSAVTVRFLTQRYIGEYDSQKDLVYHSTTYLTGTQIDFEIIDTCRDQTDCIPTEKLMECAAFVVVYSICSKSSFLIAADCLRHLLPRGQPTLLIANKKDLEHAREVTTEEGQSLANELGGVYFAEVSAAECFVEVADAFRTVIADVCTAVSKANSSPTNTVSRRKNSVLSVSKIISAMFGRSGNMTADAHGQKKRPSLSL